MKALVGVLVDAFEITGRGPVFVIRMSDNKLWRIKPGDRLVLKKPDGAFVETVLRGCSFPKLKDNTEIRLALWLDPAITSKSIPPETEFWTAG